MIWNSIQIKWSAEAFESIPQNGKRYQIIRPNGTKIYQLTYTGPGEHISRSNENLDVLKSEAQKHYEHGR